MLIRAHICTHEAAIGSNSVRGRRAGSLIPLHAEVTGSSHTSMFQSLASYEYAPTSCTQFYMHTRERTASGGVNGETLVARAARS